MELTKHELMNLRQMAHKAQAFGDGTLRIDANDLCQLIETALELEHGGGDAVSMSSPRYLGDA
jgi:hypothetical protein